MRFGIFRRFSYLIHRRTRSDSAVFPRVASILPSSLSLDGLQQQHVSTTHVMDTILPPAPFLSPFLPLASSPDSHLTSPAAPELPSLGRDDPFLRLSAAQKHAAELSAQSSQLKATIQALQAETSYVEGATRKAKNDLEQARSIANRQKRRSADLESQINAKKHELTQCETLAEVLSDAGLIALAAAAASGSRDRENFEEDAVEAIREASTNSMGLWSKIVSLVIGPRAPDNYVNAINMTLQARQELRYWRKVSNFWKKTAREGSSGAGAPTPSSSNLSEVREALSDERKQAVEELREKRKTLYPLKASTSTGSESARFPDQLPDSQPSFTSVMSTMSNLASSWEGSTTQSAHRLAPLASDIFKQELFSSHSSQRLFHSSSQKGLRASVDKQARPSEKVLGKQKAVDAYGSTNSMPSTTLSFDSNVGQTGGSVVDSSSSNGPLSTLASFDSETSRVGAPTQQFWTSAKSDDGAGNTHNSLKSAERALESFERICNRFSGGSNIGSLQSISEGSSLLATATPDPPRIVLSRSGESSASHGCPSLNAADRAMEKVELAELASRNVPSSDAVHEGDVTLVESGSEGSNQGLFHQESDKTLIVPEGLGQEKELKAPVDDVPSPLSKSRLPVFKIPTRLSQMSKMTGSSSRKSVSSFRSRNSSSTISTVASRDYRSVKKLVGISVFRPILPLRIVKKSRPVDS